MFDARETARKALHRAVEISEEKRRKGKRRTAAIVTSLCCVLFATAVITGPPLGVRSDGGDIVFISEDQIPRASFLMPDEDAAPYEAEWRSEGKTIAIPVYEDIIGSSESNSAKTELMNPAENDCWFTFRIILSETEDTLYESGMVAPSMCIFDIVLYKALEIGEYPVDLIISSYELEARSLLNRISVKLNLFME